MKEVKIKTFKDLNKPLTKKQKEEYKIQEASYRRGFRHGYDQALDDAPDGVTNYHYKFFNKVLTPWSYFKDKISKTGKIMVFPPTIGGK